MDDTGKIITVNKTFTDSVGYLPHEIQGRNVTILFTPEDRENHKAKKEINEVLERGYALDNNYLVCKDGTVKWAFGESILIKSIKGNPRILKILHNIRQQKTSKRVPEHLNNLNEKLGSIIPDALILLDKGLNVIKANRSFIELFGHQFSHELPSNFAGLSKLSNAFKLMQNNVEQAIHPGKSCFPQVVEITIASGEERAFEVSCDFLENVEDENRIVLVLHDVTMNKYRDKERENAINFVAHQLRNPFEPAADQ